MLNLIKFKKIYKVGPCFVLFILFCGQLNATSDNVTKQKQPEIDHPIKAIPIYPTSHRKSVADQKSNEIPISVSKQRLVEVDHHLSKEMSHRRSEFSDKFMKEKVITDEDDKTIKTPIGRKDGDLITKHMLMARLDDWMSDERQQRRVSNAAASIELAHDNNFYPKEPARKSDSSATMAISIMPNVGDNSLLPKSAELSKSYPQESGLMKYFASKTSSPQKDQKFLSNVNIKTKKFRMTSRMPSLDEPSSINQLKRLYSNPKLVPRPPLLPTVPLLANASFRRTSKMVGPIGSNGTTPSFNERHKKVGSLKEELESQRKYLILTDRNSDPVNLAANNPTKMINLLKQGNFLELEPIPNADELRDQMDLCNKFSIGNMKILRIKNAQQNTFDEYYVHPEPISAGATSRVFHASPLNAVDIDGTPIRQCVTIKSVLLDLLPADVLDDLKKEQQFLEVFRNRMYNKHIIHLFDEYEDKAKNRLIFVLERGEEDLMQRLQKLRKQWFTEKTERHVIEQTIKDILFKVIAAVAEMHKTIIHLDLKSDNMLFVKAIDEGVEKELLKVIDFGGSEFIDPNKGSAMDERQVANVCKLRNTMWSDDRYSSPEQMKTCSKTDKKLVEEDEHIYPVSSKSDIWAIGMMLIEFLLMTPMFEIDPVVIKRSNDQTNIYNAVINLNRYHSAKKLVQQPDKPYRQYLKKIKIYFPKFFPIIQACLQIKPYRRPTARGIKNFLEGKCEFYKWRGVEECDTGFRIKNHKVDINIRKVYHGAKFFGF